MGKQLEVISLLMEWLLSLVILIGGGWMLAMGLGSPEFITGIMSIVVTFWFVNQRDKQKERSEKEKIDAALKANPPKEEE